MSAKGFALLHVTECSVRQKEIFSCGDFLCASLERTWLDPRAAIRVGTLTFSLSTVAKVDCNTNEATKLVESGLRIRDKKFHGNVNSLGNDLKASNVYYLF